MTAVQITKKENPIRKEEYFGVEFGFEEIELWETLVPAQEVFESVKTTRDGPRLVRVAQVIEYIDTWKSLPKRTT